MTDTLLETVFRGSSRRLIALFIAVGRSPQAAAAIPNLPPCLPKHGRCRRQPASISRAQAEQRMFAKLAHRGFIGDIRPLLAPNEAARLTDEAILAAFADVLGSFIAQMSGARWARTEEMSERFGVALQRPM